MRRRLPHPAAVLLVLLAALAPACAPAEGAGPPAPPVQADGGAAARDTVLARLDGRSGAAGTTPSIVGRSPEAAAEVLAEAGLELHLVPHDRHRAITVQWPPAGQPVPLDGVVEGWLGRPPQVAGADPEPAADIPAAAAPAPAPAPAPPAPPAPAVAATGPAGAGEVAVAYVLPPHTAGLLRTNPRNLPALPRGTELTGTASWYGPGFHGLRTACGGIFDQDGATLASRELRCGTVVRITGPTGRTVEATVTDWGPAEWTGRRFDLSAAVFNAIAPLGAGVVPVRVVTAGVPD
jgi:hypothetical protein